MAAPPSYGGGPPRPPNFGPPASNMMPMPMAIPGMPPMPPPWDPYYAQWYSQWYYSYYGMPQPPQVYQQQLVNQPPPQQKPSDQPPPPGFEDGPPPAKKPTLDLGAPPPPPPEQPQEELKIKPQWQAAKKGAVIYKNPRPPTPEPPKPIIPPKPVLPPPQLQEPLQNCFERPKGKMQWFYDGQSWVYASEQPPMKPPKEPIKEEFDYSYGGSEDPVAKAVLANMRGKYNKPDKPKAVPVRCEICSLTVSCNKTYESHINGKPHKKRVAQVSKMKQLEEKVKADTERAMNSIPGGSQPENPLESRPNGDIHCRVCDCNMNSGAQAQSHIVGVKHRHRMDKFMRGQRGRGQGRGGYFGNRGGFHGVQQSQPMPLMGIEIGNQVTSEEADEEYERVFAESLANNVDVEEATKIAEEAKQSALAFCEDVDLGDSAVVQQFHAENDSRFPPRGIVIISVPTAGKPGTYKCNLCSVLLTSEANLEQHLVADEHQDSLIRSSLGPLETSQVQGEMQQGRGQSKIYRGRPNAISSGSMKAQRGRRGLISYGETMPDKLSKSQKKAQPKDIASILAQRSMAVEVTPGTAAPEASKKVMPLLMSFVKGGVMEGDGRV